MQRTRSKTPLNGPNIGKMTRMALCTCLAYLPGGTGRRVFSAADEETGLPVGCPLIWVVRSEHGQTLRPTSSGSRPARATRFTQRDWPYLAKPPAALDRCLRFLQ